MGSRSTFVLCTALLLISAFCVIRDLTERKKSIPKARYGKTNPADHRWGSSGRNVSNHGHFVLHAYKTFINWAPPRGCYFPPTVQPTLIARRLKSGMAKTVPAVPAAPALV